MIASTTEDGKHIEKENDCETMYSYTISTHLYSTQHTK